MDVFQRLTRLSTGALLALALLFNLPSALAGLHRGAFDTYVHIFLADHYRRSWFNLWEPRWYLGFSVASYPPLIHQAIALISWPIEAIARWFAPGGEPYPYAWRYQAEEAGYVLVLLAVLLAYPLVVRSFARIVVGPRAASLAGLLAIVLPGLSLVLWSFGQLPSTAATLVVLLAMRRGYDFLLHGRKRHLLQAVALAGLAGALHHGAFLLVPFVGAAVVAQAWLRAQGTGLRAHGTGRTAQGTRGAASQPLSAVRRRSSVVRRQLSALLWERVRVPQPANGFRPSSFIFRLLTWIFLSALAVGLALWPLLAWSRGQGMQTPIDHLSRHNLLLDRRAALFFFWPVYGPLLLVVPWTLRAAASLRRRLLVPACLALTLLVMGLGGTTPLPRLLYGAGWAWLTYERFAFWAALMLLPFAALLLMRLARREPRWAGLFLAMLLAVAVVAASLSTLTHSQPPVVDMAPLARFLAEPENRPYRYFTLGFGDQLARLSVVADNGTPDGTYHTARGLPELRRSGLGAIDTVMWTHEAWDAGPFLAQAERYGVRWAFVNHDHYPDVLRAAGWVFRYQIGMVELWEKPGVRPVSVSPPPGLDRSPAALWWGLAPLALLALAVVAHAAGRPWRAWRLAWRRERPARALGRLRLGLWAATLVLTTLWWHHKLWQGGTPWVYFVYQSVLLFACDLTAAASVAAWLVERALRGAPLRLGPRGLLAGGLALLAASTLSLQDSVAPPLTLAVIAHLLLLAGWVLMLINDPPAPRLAGTLLAAIAGLQALLAGAEALTQTTAWLHGLNLPWPGTVTPQMSGVSVIQLAGRRWLRAYGTLSHPNILGGLLLPGLAAAGERYLSTHRRGWLVVGWAIAIGLLLTVSRSALAGALCLAALAAGRLWPWRQGRHAAGLRARRWTVLGVVALALFSLPVLPMLLARAGLGRSVPLEQRSLDDRARLNRAAAGMLLDRPLAGAGAGAFVVRLYQVAGVDLPLEPAHNLPLLLAAEMGVPGLAAQAVLLAALGWRLWRRRQAAGIAEWLMAAALAGMLVTGLFDHYWWTMPPARLMLATVLGLWVGWGDAANRSDSRTTADGARSARQSAAPLPG